MGICKYCGEHIEIDNALHHAQTRHQEEFLDLVEEEDKK